MDKKSIRERREQALKELEMLDGGEGANSFGESLKNLGGEFKEVMAVGACIQGLDKMIDYYEAGVRSTWLNTLFYDTLYELRHPYLGAKDGVIEEGISSKRHIADLKRFVNEIKKISESLEGNVLVCSYQGMLHSLNDKLPPEYKKQFTELLANLDPEYSFKKIMARMSQEHDSAFED